MAKWTSQVRVLVPQVNERRHKRQQKACAKHCWNKSSPFKVWTNPWPFTSWGQRDTHQLQLPMATWCSTLIMQRERKRVEIRCEGLLEGEEAKSGMMARHARKGTGVVAKNYSLALKHRHRTPRDGFGTDELFKANRTHSLFYYSMCFSSWLLTAATKPPARQFTRLYSWENTVGSLPNCPFRARCDACGISGHHPPSRAASTQTLAFFFPC